MFTTVHRTTVSNNDTKQTLPKSEINIKEPANPSRSSKIKPKNPFFVNEKPTWLENLKNYFSEYCNLSGIHGLRYLGESGRFIIEKLVWTIVLIIMSYLCISLISKAYSKWRSSPVIVTFATTETPIRKIPFPAVTICPEIKSDPNIFNYSDVFLRKVSDSYVTPEESEIFESLSLICPGMVVVSELITDFKESSSLTVNASVIANMFNVSPSNATIPDGLISWLGKIFNKDILSDIYTSEGICYSFNMIDPNELQVDPEEYYSTSTYTKSKGWSAAHGYLNENTADDFPRRTFVSGADGGLTIVLFTNHSYIDRFCSDDNEGFQVTIHHPAEFPNMNSNFRVPLDQIVSVAIKPKLIIVSEELINYKPEYRKCYFPSERKLTYFNSYSQQNCLDECLTNYTIQYCGCVAFYMPKSKSFPICGPTCIDCITTSRINYLLSNSSSTTDCNCLPSCTSLHYEVEISQSNWAWRESLVIAKTLEGNNLTDFYSNFEKSHLSRLTVYFKDMQFLALERHAVYGTVEFFSNTGGLLGLFIGFSLTSAIEIIYFLTLRVVCNIRRFGRNFWSGQEVSN